MAYPPFHSRALATTLRRLLVMAPDLEAHRAEDAGRELPFRARAEALVQRSAQHRRRHALVDGGLDRPPTLPRVGHAAREFAQVVALGQRAGGEIEQPGR